MKKKISKLLILLGGLLLTAALVWLGYNIFWDIQVGKKAQETLLALQSFIPEGESRQISDLRSKPWEEVPDYVLNPELPMPVRRVNEVDFVAILTIPALKLELPVAADCSGQNLTMSPCAYSGTAYHQDFVIAGHNYGVHFGKLEELVEGDAVDIQDMEGHLFHYHVVTMEQLSEEEIDSMNHSPYDLTLFTCTSSNRSRLAVRANLD